MIRLGKDSRLSPAEVIQKAVAFFGPSGEGLKQSEKGEGYISFEGGGGRVTVAAKAKEKGSEVDVSAMEWERQAAKFLTEI